MKVLVTGKGPLAARLPADRELVLPEAATVADALAACGVARSGCVAVLGGQAVRPDRALRDGDRLWLYPQQAGG